MISPQEQLRVVSDVARRHLALNLLTVGTSLVFPTPSASNGISSSYSVVFTKGDFPPDAAIDFGLPALNGWKIVTWKGGASVSVRFSLGIETSDLRKLLEAGASALDAVPIQSGASAQGEAK